MSNAKEKNAVKRSAHRTKIELNQKFKDENLSLNGVFKFLNKEKKGVKFWLTDLNFDLTKKGKANLLFEDINISYFLENIKGIERIYKKESTPYLKHDKKLFSVSFVLDGFKLIANL